MEDRLRYSLLILAATALLGLGCGKDGASGTAANPATADEAAEAATAAKSPKRAPAGSADAAVLAVVEGLKQNRLEAFWDFLPASFQNHVNDLVHAFAERMDPELWNKSVAVLRKLARLLKEKKELLAAARASKEPGAPPGTSPAELAAIGDLLETLLTSDVADLDKLKIADGRKLLAGVGSKLLAQLRSMGHDPFGDRMGLVTNMKVTLASSNKDRATITIEDPDGNRSDREFARVEGKWVPKDLADNWYDAIGQARARLSLLSPDNLAATKPQWMALLAALEGALEQMSAAKNEKDFRLAMKEADEKLQPFQGLVAGLVGGTASAEAEEPGIVESPPDEPIEMVAVIVKAPLGEDAQDNLRDQLNGATDDRSRAVGEITGDDVTTTVRVGPVHDVEAFARRLDFLKVTRVDPKNRIITAEPKK